MNEKCLEIISKEFCGDFEDSLYEYKTAPQLIKFFNSNFDYKDQYYSGFLTRWVYVSEKIKSLYDSGKINMFFSFIMSPEYLLQEKKMTFVEVINFVQNLKERWNKKIRPYGYQLIQIDDEFEFINIDEDLEWIGEGGFAKVYVQKSTGLVIKKLKRENLLDENSKHRFKREFEITKNLEDINGIIRVFDFNESDYFYVMEKCDTTLYDFLSSNSLSVEDKEAIIMKILDIIAKLHRKKVIHRDLSPNNIFLIGSNIKIADFGLGKNLNLVFSHQTKHTAYLGQLHYCSPEQLMMLKSAGEFSDVFSLGKLINFIFTGDPNNKNHKYKMVVEKATSQDTAARYQNASEMYTSFLKVKEFVENDRNKEEILKAIESNVYTEQVGIYISSLSSKELCHSIINVDKFKNALYSYFKAYPENVWEIIQFIESDMESVRTEFADTDNFADIAYYILRSNWLTFEVKEKAAEILNYIAVSINRFYAQRLIESLRESGIDPILEMILKSK